MGNEIGEYQEGFEKLFALALEPKDSMKMIERLAKG